MALLLRVLCAAVLVLPAFRTSAGVVFTNLYSFTGTNDGESPNGLVQGSDGNLYGTNSQGGTSGSGTVFKITSNGVFHQFVSESFSQLIVEPGAGISPGASGGALGKAEQLIGLGLGETGKEPQPISGRKPPGTSH